MSELERRGVINQYTLRSILPGKVSRTVMIIAARDKKPTLQSLKDQFAKNVQNFEQGFVRLRRFQN